MPPGEKEAPLECKLCLIALTRRQNQCFHKRNALLLIKDNYALPTMGQFRGHKSTPPLLVLEVQITLFIYLHNSTTRKATLTIVGSNVNYNC